MKQKQLISIIVILLIVSPVVYAPDPEPLNNDETETLYRLMQRASPEQVRQLSGAGNDPDAQRVWMRQQMQQPPPQRTPQQRQQDVQAIFGDQQPPSQPGDAGAAAAILEDLARELNAQPAQQPAPAAPADQSLLRSDDGWTSILPQQAQQQAQQGQQGTGVALLGQGAAQTRGQILLRAGTQVQQQQAAQQPQFAAILLTPAVISRDGSVIANLQPGDAYSNPTQLKADGTKSGANRLVEGTDYIVVPRSTVDLIRQQRGRYTDIRKGPNALEFVFEPTYTSTRQVFDHGRQRTQVRVRVDSKGNAVRDVTQERQQCSGDCDMQSDGWTTDHAYTRIQQTVSGVDSTGRQRRLLVRDVKVNPSTGEAMANVDTTYGQVGNRHGITNIKITAVGEDNGYQLGVNGNVFADQAGKSLTRDQAKEALRSLYGEGNEGLAEEDFDNIAAEAVNSGYFSSVEGGGFSMAFNALNWGQFFGKILRAREFLGISQGLSLIFDNYGDYVAERRAQLEQDFCIANGIANCIASKYCANQQPIQPQNTVLGISREGLLEPVIRLNAERTQQLILQGATAQQLIELLGTDTIIKDGRKINLSDPNLNPQVTRNLSLRLYHIQYHLVNNMQINPLEQNGEIKYNLAIGTGNEQTFSGINYYTQDKTLPFGQKTKPQDSDIYKYSFTEYETACLKLHPGIIVGNVQGSRHKRNIYCVALVDMIGDPTSITPPEGTLQANATRPAATADGEFW